MIRKIVCLLAMCVLLGSGALAQELDYSKMGLAELQEMRSAIEEELITRIGESIDNRIGAGLYIVGVDIRPGRYDFKCIQAASEDWFGCQLFIIDGAYDLQTIKTLNEEEVDEDALTLLRVDNLTAGAMLALTLVPNTTLMLRNGIGELEESKHTWTP